MNIKFIEQPIVMYGFFSGASYLALSTFVPTVQAVNLSVSIFLTPVLGAVFSYYAGLLLPALLAVGIGSLLALAFGALDGYLQNHNNFIDSERSESSSLVSSQSEEDENNEGTWHDTESNYEEDDNNEGTYRYSSS